MQVHALIGASGTGKSSSAINFAFDKNIAAIIDDGLLIHKGKRIAGTSAKFEKTAITAVKTAIFLDDTHAKTVRDAIAQLQVDSILLIGTSLRMVNKIANRLKLAPIDHIHFIEEVLTPEQIIAARHERMAKGKHIIPLSPSQLPQNILQKVFRKGVEIFSPKKGKIGESTIVHPLFHQKLLEEENKNKTNQKSKSYTTNLYIAPEPAWQQYLKIALELVEYTKRRIALLNNEVKQVSNQTILFMYEVLLIFLNKLRNTVLNYYIAYKLKHNPLEA